MRSEPTTGESKRKRISERRRLDLLCGGDRAAVSEALANGEITERQYKNIIKFMDGADEIQRHPFDYEAAWREIEQRAAERKAEEEAARKVPQL